MSAEILRQAAALMRERAEADGSRGWTKVDFNDGDGDYRPLWGVANDAYFNPPADEDEPWLAVEIHTGIEATAEHIASWHPAVALAVAEWLDCVAAPFDQMWEADEDGILRGYDLDGDSLRFDESQDSLALAVARAYLGESA